MAQLDSERFGSAVLRGDGHLQALLAAIVQSTDDAILSKDVDARVTSWNAGAERLYGYTAEEMIGRPVALLIPPDRRGEERRILRTALRGEELKHYETRRVRKDGSLVDVSLQVSPVRGDDGCVVGASTIARDVTEAKALERRLRESRERLELALVAGHMGAWEWDIATNEVRWSESLERIYGLPPGGFDGRYETYLDLIEPEDREAVVTGMRASIDAGSDHHTRHRVRRPDGQVRWIEGVGRVLRGRDGRPTGIIGVALDITEKIEADRDLEKAQERLAFLSEASRRLAESLDEKRTLSIVARLCVPWLADWCAIDMRDRSGTVGATEVFHVDPEKVMWAREIQQRFSVDVEADRLAGVVRTGRPALYPDVTDRMLVEAAKDPGHLEAVRRVGMKSLMIVPLTARGRTFGALSFVSAESGRRFGRDDLSLAEDLAARAALAIDNARLYDHQRRIARTLQQSLLPAELPRLPGVEIAARYLPSGEGFDVGGDFYDVFETDPGKWHIVLGDVCGKGPDAAAITGLARNTLRAVALRQTEPGEVLAALNEAIERGPGRKFCTLAYVTLQLDRHPYRCILTLAGHPQPLLVRHGTVERLGVPGHPLGLIDDPVHRPAAIEVTPGDVLFIYTDGITDHRGPVMADTDLDELLLPTASLHAEAIAESVEAALLEREHGHQREDDIAFVVVRVPAA